MDDVAVGTDILVRPGDKVPLDGLVTAGTSRLDHSMLTGESAPIKRAPGQEVSLARRSHISFATIVGINEELRPYPFKFQRPQLFCCSWVTDADMAGVWRYSQLW